MKTLKEYILEADKNGTAIGHFNIANIETMWGVFNAARNLDVPVIIGVSEGERDFIGIKQSVVLIRSLREEFDFPVFLNADHSYSFDRVKEAIDAGFDMVIYDGSNLPYDENVDISKRCADYAAQSPNDVLVEAELGFIGSGSNVKESIPEGVSEETQTKPNDALEFIKATGVDLLAPSVGNIHGIVKSGNPQLNIQRIKDIRETAGVPLVLHGGSGSSDEDFVHAAHAGMSIIHISTELRLGYLESLKASLEETKEIAPYKYLKKPRKEIERIVEARIKLFSGIK
ncbi:tagatose-bisphosphate aldolase [Candidatus Wolfebacteria bacterium]|nr:MAG: tagatose-bisphosphate aldolase [Candidatus Wolfebacteria bacterium]